MIYLTGISVTFFLAALLVGEKNKSASHVILTVWLLFIGVHLSAYYAFASRAYLSFPYYLGFEIPLPFVHGPFLYGYTRSLTALPGRRTRLWRHFIPFLAAYIPLLPFLILPAAQRMATYQHNGQGYESLMAVMNAGIMLSGVLYVSLSLLELRRYKKFIQDQFSDTDKINLIWLRYLILGISVIWVCVILGKDSLVFALSTLFVLFVGYFGIKQVGLVARHPAYARPGGREETGARAQPGGDDGAAEAVTDAAPAPEERYKYEKSGLKEEQIGAIHQLLTTLMAGEKWFKNPDLALSDLADRLDIHPNYLSQVINSVEGKNFYDYVNEHRVEEFKRIVALPENQWYTLLALAFECGFSSKTSFNRNFKKAAGITPSEYLTRLNIHLESERDAT